MCQNWYSECAPRRSSNHTCSHRALRFHAHACFSPLLVLAGDFGISKSMAHTMANAITRIGTVCSHSTSSLLACHPWASSNRSADQSLLALLCFALSLCPPKAVLSLPRNLHEQALQHEGQKLDAWRVARCMAEGTCLPFRCSAA